ncbi:MAG TPA: hypothetical protein VEZ89_16530 [Rubrivivax sp.]|nr:hypothetical protein [Rubrivivax sp.]
MSSICTAASTPVVSSAEPLLQRWGRLVVYAWKTWRAQVILQRELRALEGLSDATLRDLGLAERALKRPTLSELDYERGRW